MDLSKIKNIYMIGVKGAGMTMLAEFLTKRGLVLSGSDTGETFMTDSVLASAGVKVYDGFSEERIKEGNYDLIIYSTAYNSETNEEVRAALSKPALATKTVTYAQALAELFNNSFGIAVCGSHGKTTVTAWLGYVADRAGLKPGVMVGAKVPQFKGAGLAGDSSYLIIEADEYQNKLQYYRPRLVLLNNIEYDHPDFFPNQASYEKVFADFVRKVPKSGAVIVNQDDIVAYNLVKENTVGRVIGYGFKQTADYSAKDLIYDKGYQYFHVSLRDQETGVLEDLGSFAISLSGQHNVLNALAVIATSIELGLELKDIREHLKTFSGTARRMQIMGEYRRAIILDDYGHHPTEIKATLEAVRQKYSKEKLRVVFHPHTFTRTKALLKEFAKSFTLADEVIVLDIYGSAREEQGGISAQEVVEEIKGQGHSNVSHQGGLKETEEYLRQTIKEGEVILLLGAGDVFRIGERLLENEK